MNKLQKRVFETKGMVSPEKSYYVPLENVVNENNQDMKTMVDWGRYFTIFAPRQSGKTTFFEHFCKDIEKEPTYIAIQLSFQKLRNNSTKDFYQYIQKKLYKQLINKLKEVNCPQLESVLNFLNQHFLRNHMDFNNLFEELNDLIKYKKIVIFIDEFDGIPKNDLVDFLMTLRDLYQEYKGKDDKALYSVGLVGIRNIARLTVDSENPSPFNIADEVKLPSFTLNNVRSLYEQYTQETGHAFSEEAVQKIFEQTSGQPWLVNRLGLILTNNDKTEKNKPITLKDINMAIDSLLKEENDHFTNLSEKLFSYHRAFKNILDDEVEYNPEDNGQAWLTSYGLIKNENGLARVFCPIYAKRFKKQVDEGMVKASGKNKKIFISYAREDRQFLDKLLKYCLDPIKKEGFEYWFDEKIRVGFDWSPEISENIETSNIAICIITSRFLGSDFINDKELPLLLKRREYGMMIIPILFETCIWKRKSWLKNIQIYPRNGIPFDDLDNKMQKKLLVQVAEDICEIFDS